MTDCNVGALRVFDELWKSVTKLGEAVRGRPPGPGLGGAQLEGGGTGVLERGNIACCKTVFCYTPKTFEAIFYCKTSKLSIIPPAMAEVAPTADATRPRAHRIKLLHAPVLATVEENGGLRRGDIAESLRTSSPHLVTTTMKVLKDEISAVLDKLVKMKRISRDKSRYYIIRHGANAPSPPQPTVSAAVTHDSKLITIQMDKTDPSQWVELINNLRRSGSGDIQFTETVRTIRIPSLQSSTQPRT